MSQQGSQYHCGVTQISLLQTMAASTFHSILECENGDPRMIYAAAFASSS